MLSHFRRLALAFLIAFGLIALVSGYWTFVARETLTARADNPRRVLLERRFKRGTIFDRNGEPLAYSIGEPGELTRYYPYPDLAPVLGYISAFYGAAGIEAAADPLLHGDAERPPFDLWRNDLLGAYPPGRDVRLSIDLRLQRHADALLGAHTGAVVLLDPLTGEILALASHPTYDANQLEDNWETLIADPRSPFLNRATLALYQPGGALQPVILAAALRANLAPLDAPYPSATAQVGVGDLTLGCLSAPSAAELSLAEAFAHGCPWPFADLGNQLGARALDQLFRDFRFFEAPPIALPTIASPEADLATEAPFVAIGQGTLTLTPLHLALATAALARDGQLPAPHLILAEQNVNRQWQAIAPGTHPLAALAPAEAGRVKALMPAGHASIALTNATGQTLAWFSGFAPRPDARYVVAVLLEDGTSDKATEIGQALLAAVAP